MSKPYRPMGHDNPIVQIKRVARMARVDDLPPDVRLCVYDYGLTVVTALTDLGVVKARHIRHVVETVLNEFSPTRGSFSQQGVRTPYNVVEKRDA